MEVTAPTRTPYFPPIALENPDAWVYESTTREIGRVNDVEDFFYYIWRIFVAIVTCQVFSEGFPERLAHREITHEVKETFRLRNGSQINDQDLCNLLLYLVRPFQPRDYSVDSSTLRHVNGDGFAISYTGRVLDWSRRVENEVYCGNQRVDVPYRGRGNESRGALVSEDEFNGPTVEGIRRRQMHGGNAFVLSDNPRTAKLQLQAGFAWLGKPDESDALLAALRKLEPKSGEQLFDMSRPVQEQSENARLPSISGRWVVSMLDGCNKYLTVQTNVDPSKVSENNLIDRLRSNCSTMSCFPDINGSSGEVGYSFGNCYSFVNS